MSTNFTWTVAGFNFFITSVLRQIASKKNQEVLFDSYLPFDLNKGKTNKTLLFDAVAPNGFNEISGTVIFEFKCYQQSISFDRLQSILNGLYKRVMQLTVSDVTLILITNSCIDSYTSNEIIRAKIPYKNNVDVIIWDKRFIDEWINNYPIDFSNSQSLEVQKKQYQINNVTENDFTAKSQNNIAIIKRIIEQNDNFAFVLGAGVSVDPGAKSWNCLLGCFTDELKKRGIIKEPDKLKDKIGGSSIITAQLCKELYHNESDYYWAIHEGLYSERKPINTDYALYHIAVISKRCNMKSHYRILTYNYDNYLESYLDYINESYNILYDSKSNINSNLSIYHVHGYLPEVKYKSHILDQYRQSIYLTEENYNELYNHPYSWQISSQLSFFRENICLFVGCSLADPNIRRLLEMTKAENHSHYAILTKDGMTVNDLIKASNHFARIGIEVIWVNNYSDISSVLRLLY